MDLRAGDILVTVNGEYVVLEQVQHEILEAPVKVYNFEVADWHTYYVSGAGVLVHNECPQERKAEEYADREWYEQPENPGGKGRGKNKIQPHEGATEGYVVYRQDPVTGEITHYNVYDVNPLNPTGFDETLKYHGTGDPHFNKVTGEYVTTPHVHDDSYPGGIRKPNPGEMPR